MKIWHLSWKDDSFRLYNWAGTGATSDGDFIYIPANTQVFRPIYPLVAPSNIFSIDMRARYKTAPSQLTITLYDSTGVNPIYTTSPQYDINGNPLGSSGINSSTYAYYTTGGPVAISSPVGGIGLTSGSNEIDLDYICFTINDFIDVGGMRQDVTINKRTPVFRIPNTIDVIQQLGIASRTQIVVFPKVQRPSFNWFEDKVRTNMPVEFLSPTFQATGFLVESQGNSHAGWVGVGIDGGSPAQLYDVTATFVKADRDMDAINATFGLPVLIIKVIDASTLKPIAGASVTIVGASNQTGTTNSAGNANFAGVGTGSYTVTASATGYATGTQTVNYVGGTQTFTIALSLGISLTKVVTIGSSVGLTVLNTPTINKVATIQSSRQLTVG